MSPANAMVVIAGAALFAAQRRVFMNAKVASVISPGWVAVASTIFVVSMFSISVAIQNHIEPRTLDGILYVALAAFYLWVGIVFHRPLRPTGSPRPPAESVFIAALFGVGLLSTPNFGWELSDAVSVSRSFSHEYRSRLKLLREASGHPDAHVVFAPFTKRPHATFLGDLAADPKFYTNIGMAKYYGIADIRLGTENRIYLGSGTMKEQWE